MRLNLRIGHIEVVNCGVPAAKLKFEAHSLE